MFGEEKNIDLLISLRKYMAESMIGNHRWPTCRSFLFCSSFCFDNHTRYDCCETLHGSRQLLPQESDMLTYFQECLVVSADLADLVGSGWSHNDSRVSNPSREESKNLPHRARTYLQSCALLTVTSVDSMVPQNVYPIGLESHYFQFETLKFESLWSL